MCIGVGGSSGPDPSEVAREQEELRQKRIREGTQSINNQFARFDGGFFNRIESDANAFFQPQLQEQFFNTRENVIKDLARRGNLSGSVGARQLGDLNKELSTQQALLSDKARGFSNRAKGDIESNRAQLIQNLAASSDPFAAANAAAASAEALTAPPEFKPLDDLFTKFANLATPQIIANDRGFRNPASLVFGNSQNRQTIVN